MKSITIKGSKRESVGKKATKALRNAGQVPCVLYGGDTPLHFSAPEVEFNSLVYTADVHTVVIELEDGSKANAVLQDIQFHPVTDVILHIDFYQFTENQEITMEIPVHTQGVARGVKSGGVLRLNLRRLRVRGLAQNLPDYITAEVTNLRIGNKLYVTAVESEDYTILHPDNTVICQVRTSRNAVADDDDDDDTEGTSEATETAEA
ncbi:large subunit ribosomal protein L25 [Mesonia hippocampi]|uniref:Large ribosomal subunit protein bL25 n=1 Tax=Mesonia hippocampi TaxID=1628250 RepID=A0A840EJ17_9FLAO|nr:50S ribosomal protein L25/general stress protein Ctc [Mesonia hippocampi]MBB4118369.1 large subunit ribosomal protein L25 [Mesonia hippocampi]